MRPVLERGHDRVLDGFLCKSEVPQDANQRTRNFASFLAEYFGEGGAGGAQPLTSLTGRISMILLPGHSFAIFRASSRSATSTSQKPPMTSLLST